MLKILNQFSTRINELRALIQLRLKSWAKGEVQMKMHGLVGRFTTSMLEMLVAYSVKHQNNLMQIQRPSL